MEKQQKTTKGDISLPWFFIDRSYLASCLNNISASLKKDPYIH
jgi:hypothetical protein